MTRDAESFLGAVLSRGGPLALPYDGQMKRLVRLHLLELIKARPALAASAALPRSGEVTSSSPRLQDLPSLSVRLRSYTHLDGRCSKPATLGYELRAGPLISPRPSTQ